MRGNLLFPDRYITVASKFKLSLLEILPSCTNEVIVGESTQFLRSVVCENVQWRSARSLERLSQYRVNKLKSIRRLSEGFRQTVVSHSLSILVAN